MLEEKTLRTWVQRWLPGEASRRELFQYMLKLGISGPFLASLLAAYTPARAGSTSSFFPTRRGGGGALRLLWWQAPTILNGHLALGAKDSDAARVVYEPLASLNAEGNLVPILAAEIPSYANGDLSRDGRSVTWRLKKGVVWHDGMPFTAEDIIFTWEYAADPATGAASMAGYQTIDRIEKQDAHTVTLIFKEPRPYWYHVFCGRGGYILPKHLFAPYKGDQARNAPYNYQPIGTGPYKLVEFKPGDMVRYEINPHYHIPNRPFFDTVELKGGGDATSAARAVLQTGEFDYAWNIQVEQPVLRRLEQSGKGRVVLTPGSWVEHIQINQTDPWTEVEGERSSVKVPHPFQTDLRVRQAYAKAVDRRTIAEQLYGPTGQATSNFLVAPPRFASPNTTWEFDLSKAAALLDQAGWLRGSDGIRVKAGQRMQIVFQTSTNSIRQKTQAIIKKAFTEIGIAMELKAINPRVYFSTDPGNPDTFAHFYADIQMYSDGSGIDPQGHMMKFVSWEIAQKANHWAGLNTVRWAHPAYDALWKQAQTELDPIKRAALFIQMNDMIIDQAVVIPIVWRHKVSAASQSLRGLGLTTWDSDLWYLAYWYREA